MFPEHLVRIGNFNDIVLLGADATAIRALCSHALAFGATLRVADTHISEDMEALFDEYGYTPVIHHCSGLDALPHCTDPDLIILNEDFNWYTTFNQLQLIEQLFATKRDVLPPVVMVNGIGWPSGRRDFYKKHGNVPKAHRQNAVSSDMIFPVLTTEFPENLRNECAEHEQTVRNGVLTALQDFMAESSAYTGAYVNVTPNGADAILITDHHANPELFELIDQRCMPLIQFQKTEVMHETWMSTLSAHASSSQKRLKVLQQNTIDLKRRMSVAQKSNEQRIANETQALLRQLRLERDHIALLEMYIQNQKKADAGKHEELQSAYRQMQRKYDEVTRALEASNASRQNQALVFADELEKTQRQLAKTHEELRRVYGTRSWKWTRFMRDAEQYLKDLSDVRSMIHSVMYALFGMLKAVWSAMGQPCPRLVRGIRYGFFGNWKPRSRNGAHEINDTKISNHIDRTKRNEQSRTELLVLIFGDDHGLLDQTLEALTEKPIPHVVHIVVMYPRKNVHVQRCMRRFRSDKLEFVQFDAPLKSALIAKAYDMKIPYVCMLRSANTLDMDTLVNGLHRLENSHGCDALAFDSHRDATTSFIDIPPDKVVASPIPTIARLHSLPRQAQTPIRYMPVPGNDMSAVSYPSPPIHSD